MFKAIIKTILILLWIAISCLILWLVKKTGSKKWFWRVCNFGFAGLCFIVGLRIKMVGEVSLNRPLMLISNHISYLDMLILGAKTPVRFTSKSEVAGWIGIGGICRLLGAVFIERKSQKIGDASDKIQDALAAGEVVSLFAEGTTGDGVHLLPFKSSLFSIVENGKIFVQPAIVKYTKIGQLPIDSTQFPKIAWYGDMTLLPHLWQLLQLGKIDATLTLLPAFTSAEIGNRKQLAAHCQKLTQEVLDF